MIAPMAIKPAKRRQSYFYSWQLYRWAKTKPTSVQIWRGTWNGATGIDRNAPVLYIGHMDRCTPDENWLHGRMLRNLCLFGQNLAGYAYGPAHDTKHWEEITTEWWAEYMEKGVCAIHGEMAHKWTINSDKRTCAHCRKEEYRTTEVVKRDVWIC